MYYDVIILGGGPAGYRAARCLDDGKKILIVEKDKIGGTCLHRGCIPTKSMISSVRKMDNYNDILCKKDKDILSLYKGLEKQIKSRNIDILNESGKLGGKEGDYFIVFAGTKKYYAKNIIIATGSRNRTLEIPGANNNEYVVYSDQFLDLKTIPQRVTIIGGGVIGLEFASILLQLKRDVTILESKSKILENLLDEDVINSYKKCFSRSSIKLIEGVNIQEIDAQSVIYEKDGVYEEITSDIILVAVGRRGNTEDIGLDTLGINFKCGEIFVNDYCETNIEGIYACGDIIGKSMLAHVAYREAEIAASNIKGIPIMMNYSAIPNVIYSEPELATVGMTEKQCSEQGIQYYVKKASMLYSSRYMIEYGEQRGVCKIIFNSNSEIIGAQLVGNSSSEIVFVLADMIALKMKEQDIKEKIYPHPSFMEIIKETVLLPTQ